MKNRSQALAFLIIIGIFAFAAAAWRAGAQSSDPRKQRAEAMEARMRADREAKDGPDVDLASLPRASVAAGTIVYAYETTSQRLVSFDASDPGTILTSVTLTGFSESTQLYGIDFRPADGVLYGILNAPSFPSRLVQIDPISGAVTSVHPTNTIPGVFDIFYGFDFDPVEDRVRNVGNLGLNRRINPNNGSLFANDTPLRYVQGDVRAGFAPNVVHIASRSVPGSGTSTVYGIDTTANTLVRIGGVDGNPSASTGELTTIGSLGLDPTNFGSMDIQPGAATAYAALFINQTPMFVSIDLSTGAASVIGRIGDDNITVIDGLAVQIGPIVTPTPGPTATPTPTPAATPQVTPTPGPTATPTRFVRVGAVGVIPGQGVDVPITVGTLGPESTIRFNLAFDPARLTNAQVRLAPVGGLPNSTLSVTSLAGSGVITATISSPTPFPAGTYEIARFNSGTAQNADFGTAAINFSDSPVTPGFFTSSGASLPGVFQPGSVTSIISAAGVEVSGRVLTADGRGLRRAVVTLTDSLGTQRTATTGSFGYYKFADVVAGANYVIGVASKRYDFRPRVVNVADSLTDVDFVAN